MFGENRNLLVLWAVVGLLLGFYGCRPSTTSEPRPSVEAEAHGNHPDAGQSDMDAMHAQLAKLSPEDAASAEKQHVCPVSGEMLGLMGPPVKVDVQGTQVWICCDDCREQLLAEPEQYLAKLRAE
jgi:Cu(I)/Ag(I) efflux system membrane fusion protein